MSLVKIFSHSLILCLSLFFSIFSHPVFGEDLKAQRELKAQYEYSWQTPSDINEHLPLLRQLASECSSVVEVGMREMVSSWGLLMGLSESPYENRSYLGFDLEYPPLKTLQLAQKLAQRNGIAFHFSQKNDMIVDVIEADLLFIDSLHTYCHLTYELEKFSSTINKYIALHDTSEPWGDQDDTEYHGDYSEYPADINRTKRGLWLAVEDFLDRHPEWILEARHVNNHGFTILKRVSKE